MQARSRQPKPEAGGYARTSIPESASESIEPGRLIGGRYRLERQLGRRHGVWLARDAAGHPYALKTGEPVLVEHEFGVLSSLGHPHIVRVQELIEDRNPFLVLEYLPGGDCVSLAGAEPRCWIRHLADLVDALEYLHGCGFVHRDLKARNLLFDAADRVRLVDFGSALRVGSAWSAAGTTREAVDAARGDRPVGPADDVYALAALVHELLHGTPPGKSVPAPRGRSVPEGPPARAVETLEALVGEALAPADGISPPTLDRFRAGIESVSANLRA